MPTPPTREEILAEFSQVLDRFYGPIQEDAKLPSSEECQKEGAWLQVLGKIKGWVVVAMKKPLGVCLALFLFYGDVRQSVDYIIKDTQVAYSNVSEMVKYSYQNRETPATEFVTHAPPENWPFQSKEKIQFIWTPQQQTTTTPPPPRQSVTTTLAPGSGLVPRSPQWGYYS